MRLRRHCQRLAKVETLLIALSLEAALPRCPDNAARELNLTPNGRWTEARWLRLGDKFLTRTGVSATVVGLTIRTERVQVYNLQVKNLQLYAVGQAGVLVHNSLPHGNARAHPGPTILYGLYSRAGAFLKWGVSNNPMRRYSREFMRDKELLPFASGSRDDMLAAEKWLRRHNAGPLNRECDARNIVDEME